MKLDIVQHPDPRLAQPCAPVVTMDPTLVENMFETMYAAPGRGLAAPQVGVMVRMFVMDATWKDGDMSPAAFINPQITDQGGSQTNTEACLSIADVERKIERPAWVDVTWTAVDGTTQSCRYEGFSAACVCHEMDHLDGKLILDHRVAP